MRKAIVDAINRILDEWDPIGVNHFQGRTGDEYISYVPLVVRNYVADVPTYASLDKLQVNLIDNGSQEMIDATSRAAVAVDEFLAGYSRAELKNLFP